jgi:hypothetical protein
MYLFLNQFRRKYAWKESCQLGKEAYTFRIYMCSYNYFLKSLNGTSLSTSSSRLWVFFVCGCCVWRLRTLLSCTSLSGIKTNLPSDFLCVTGMKRRAWTALNSPVCHRSLHAGCSIELDCRRAIAQLRDKPRARSGNWDGAIKWPRWLLGYCLSRGKNYTYICGERERWTLTHWMPREMLLHTGMEPEVNEWKWLDMGFALCSCSTKKEWRNASGI